MGTAAGVILILIMMMFAINAYVIFLAWVAFWKSSFRRNFMGNLGLAARRVAWVFLR